MVKRKHNRQHKKDASTSSPHGILKIVREKAKNSRTWVMFPIHTTVLSFSNNLRTLKLTMTPWNQYFDNWRSSPQPQAKETAWNSENNSLHAPARKQFYKTVRAMFLQKIKLCSLTPYNSYIASITPTLRPALFHNQSHVFNSKDITNHTWYTMFAFNTWNKKVMARYIRLPIINLCCISTLIQLQ